MKNIVYWAPRILTIIFILFISLFALDSFDGDKSFMVKLGAFLIHLIPTAILIILLVISWRREWIGGIIFILLGILYIAMTWGRFPVSTYILISGPLFLIAVLFLVNWINKKPRKIF